MEKCLQYGRTATHTFLLLPLTDRTKEESYRRLSVPIIDTVESPPSVEQCLQCFFQPEDIEIQCEKCQDGSTATQTLRILSRPKALLIHLQRYHKTVKRGVNAAARVELTPELSLDRLFQSEPSSSSNKKYDLKSIVYHHVGGGENHHAPSSGHYTTDALRWDDGGHDAQWVFFDDDKKGTETTLESITGSDEKKQSAYMLLYEAA